MTTITASNTNTMMLPAYNYIMANGIEQDSRNGRVISVPYPVTLTYAKPYQQVNLCPVRDANPFFHFMERLWFLEGVGDTKFICHYLPRMMDFSDDGMYFNAHYGARLRQAFNLDQLKCVVDEINKDPDSRQLVCQIWEPHDLYKETKDKACNTQLVFRVLRGELSMTAFNRSNDAIMGGVSGANITNLFVFQEYVAGMAGLRFGPLHVVSNNLHLYIEELKTNMVVKHYLALCNAPLQPNPYAVHSILPWSMVTSPARFDNDLQEFMMDLRSSPKNEFVPSPYNPGKYENSYFPRVASPIALSYYYYKQGDLDAALNSAMQIASLDWCIACTSWLQRRIDARS